MIDGQPADPGLGDTVQVIKQHLAQFVADSKASFSLVMEVFRQQVDGMIDQSVNVFGINHISLDYFATLLSSTSSAISLESRVAACVQAYRHEIEANLFLALEKKVASVENYEAIFLERIKASLEGLKDNLATSAMNVNNEFMSMKGW